MAEGVLLSSEPDCRCHDDVQADNHPLMLGAGKTYQVDVNALSHLSASCPHDALVRNHLIVLEEDRTYLVGESILDLYDSHAQRGLQKEHNRLKALVGDTLFLEGSYILPSGAVQGGWLGSIRLTSLGVGKTCSEGACTPLLGDADLYWLVGRNSHHRGLVEGSFCLEASGIRRYYDAPLLPAWVRSSCLQEKEASKTCQEVA